MEYKVHWASITGPLSWPSFIDEEAAGEQLVQRLITS
jgi:hypothetical protein